MPSNFTLQTGKDHWEALLRARAIDTQCWIVAAASYGTYEERGAARSVYGHSLVADPWGHVVAKCSDGIGWATARIDRAVTARVRARHAAAGTSRRRARLVARPARDTARLAILAAQNEAARAAQEALAARYGAAPTRQRGRHRRARRRRLHAGDAAPLPAAAARRSTA